MKTTKWDVFFVNKVYNQIQIPVVRSELPVTPCSTQYRICVVMFLMNTVTILYFQLVLGLPRHRRRS